MADSTLEALTEIKFTYSTVGLVFTASGASLKNIKYTLIRASSGTGAGKVVCVCMLSTAAFKHHESEHVKHSSGRNGGLYGSLKT